MSLLLRNLSDPDFGNYSCYVAAAATDAPRLLCSLVLKPAEEGERGRAGGRVLGGVTPPSLGVPPFSGVSITWTSPCPTCPPGHGAGSVNGGGGCLAPIPTSLCCSAEVLKNAEPDMIMVVCVLTAAFTAVAIGVLICCRCGRRCCGRRGGCCDGGGQPVNPRFRLGGG